MILVFRVVANGNSARIIPAINPLAIRSCSANGTDSIEPSISAFHMDILAVVVIGIISSRKVPVQFVAVSTSRSIELPRASKSSFVEPYRDVHHRYIDALLTAKLGLGYITGILELLLGALIYVMCLPCVRKTGHFQVRTRMSPYTGVSSGVLLLLLCSYSTGATC